MADPNDPYASDITALTGLISKLQPQTTFNPANVDISNINPYQDPAFAAYMRGQGISEANLQAEIALKQNQLNQTLQQGQPGYEEQRQNATKNIAGSSAARGIFNSGERIQNQTQAVGDINRNQQQWEQGIQNQQQSLQQQLTASLAQQQANAAEQTVNAQKGIALQNAGVGIYNAP